MKEEEFLKKIEKIEGIKDGAYVIPIYFNLDENDNVVVDFEEIGEGIKRIERELINLGVMEW